MGLLLYLQCSIIINFSYCLPFICILLIQLICKFLIYHYSVYFICTYKECFSFGVAILFFCHKLGEIFRKLSCWRVISDD